MGNEQDEKKLTIKPVPEGVMPHSLASGLARSSSLVCVLGQLIYPGKGEEEINEFGEQWWQCILASLSSRVPQHINPVSTCFLKPETRSTKTLEELLFSQEETERVPFRRESYPSRLVTLSIPTTFSMSCPGIHSQITDSVNHTDFFSPDSLSMPS